MKPGRYDLALYRGDSHKWRFVLWADKLRTNPVILDDATVAAQFRDQAGGAVIIMELTCTITSPNIVVVEITPDMWDDVTATEGAWDLEVTFSDASVHTPIAGEVTVDMDVTHTVPSAGSFSVEQTSVVPPTTIRRPVQMRQAVS